MPSTSRGGDKHTKETSPPNSNEVDEIRSKKDPEKSLRVRKRIKIVVPDNQKVVAMIHIASVDSSGTSGGMEPRFSGEFISEIQRKAREAERWRLENIRMIKERNAEVGGVEPTDIIPKEAWKQVLSRMTPEDRANTWEVHPVFREIMEADRIRDILFPLVLDDKRDYIGRECIYPHQNSRVQELRKVSKAMCSTIDKWLEHDYDSSLKNKNTMNFTVWKTQLKPIKFQMAYEIEELVEIPRSSKLGSRMMKVTIRSPSLLGEPEEGGKSYLNCFNIFKNNVTLALEQVGEKIDCFVFDCNEMYEFEEIGISRAEVSQILCDWLRLTPNVKRIEIILTATNLRRSFMPGFKPLMLKPIDEDIMPSAPKLHALDRIDLIVMLACPSIFLPISAPIMESNPQAKLYTSDDDREEMRNDLLKGLLKFERRFNFNKKQTN